MKQLVKEYVARYNELAEKYGFASTSELEISEVDLCEELLAYLSSFNGAVLAENDLYECGEIDKDDVSEFLFM